MDDERPRQKWGLNRMQSFHYHSKEFKKTPEGSRQNIVSVRNGKGTKRKMIYNRKGKLIENMSEKLKSGEIKNIKNAVFMPGLFNMRKRTRKIRN